MNEASLRDRPIIQIRNLSKVYFMGEERVIALKNINLSINRGEICCIFGTSGSGKSTLLNALMDKPQLTSSRYPGTTLDFNPLDIHGVTVYDTQFHALWHNDEAIGARRILLTDDGTVFVLYNSNARIFTARSAQSREVTADAAAADS